MEKYSNISLNLAQSAVDSEPSGVGQQPDSQAERDKKFMLMAINEAHKALKIEEVPIGAVVVCGDRVIGRGHNLVETLCDATAHAEMQSITAAAATLGGKYLKGCTLYVTVEPCVMCAGALAWSQIDRVVYGADDPKRGYTTVSGRIFHPKTVVERGVLADECEALMTEFFKSLR
jgi:tRNA(adenine34) deaminase